MEKLLGLVSSIERAIRYLLSGIVIAVVWLLSRNDAQQLSGWVEQNQMLAGVCVMVIGAVAFTLYRVTFWTVGDWVAWKLKLSAPSLHTGREYADVYSSFLRWRHSDKLPNSVSRYLWYRWAAAHFSVVTGVSLLMAVPFKDDRSVVAEYPIRTCVVGCVAMLLGISQVKFLFAVEKKLQAFDESATQKQTQ